MEIYPIKSKRKIAFEIVFLAIIIPQFIHLNYYNVQYITPGQFPPANRTSISSCVTLRSETALFDTDTSQVWNRCLISEWNGGMSDFSIKLKIPRLKNCILYISTIFQIPTGTQKSSKTIKILADEEKLILLQVQAKLPEFIWNKIHIQFL